MGFQRFMKNFDIFGSQIQLRFENQLKNKTLFGGIYSIMLFGAILFSIFQEFSSIIDKQNPNLIQIQEIMKKSDQIISNTKFLNLKFLLRRLSNGIPGQVLTQGINYKSEAKFRIFKVDSTSMEVNIIQFPLNLTECPEQPKYTCLSIDSLNTLYPSIQRYLDQGYETSDLQILLLKTDPDLPNKIDEQNSTIIDKTSEVVFSDGILSLQCQDNIFNNYRSPFFRYVRKEESDTNTNAQQRTIIYFKQFITETDQGIYSESMDVIKNYMITRVEDKIVLQKNYEERIFHEILIQYDGILREKYRRSYQKIWNIFANIGGILKILMLVGNFLCKPISSLDMREKIVNRLFKFQVNEKFQDEFQLDIKLQKYEKKFHNLEINQNSEMVNLQDKNPDLKFQECLSEYSPDKIGEQLPDSPPRQGSLSPMRSDKKNKNSFQRSIRRLDEEGRAGNHLARRGSLLANKIIEDLAQSRKFENSNSFLENNKKKQEDQLYEKQKQAFESIFNFTKRIIQLSQLDHIFYYVFPFFDQIKRKKQLLDFAYKTVASHLDTNYLMKQLQQIDKIKLLLLNQDQLHLFQYMPPPVIETDYLFLKNENSIQKQNSNEDQQEFSNESLQIQNVAQNRVNQAFFDNRSELQKATDAFNSLKNIKLQDVYSEMDEQLVCFLDPIILDIFKENRNMIGRKIQVSINNGSLNTQQEFFNIKHKNEGKRDKSQFNSPYQLQTQEALAEMQDDIIEHQQSGYLESQDVISSSKGRQNSSLVFVQDMKMEGIVDDYDDSKYQKMVVQTPDLNQISPNSPNYQHQNQSKRPSIFQTLSTQKNKQNFENQQDAQDEANFPEFKQEIQQDKNSLEMYSTHQIKSPTNQKQSP